MASSYVDYQGNGAWCRDAVPEGWPCLAVLELRSRSRLTPWERTVQQAWSFRAEAGIMGVVDPQLDHLLGTARREAAFLALLQAVQDRLWANGKTVPADRLNTLLPPGNRWEQDPRAEWFSGVGTRLQALVAGQALPDAATFL